MKPKFFAFVLILALAGFAFAQGSASSTPAPQAANPSPDDAAINSTLNTYVNAYMNKSIDQLVAIWPDLPNQKKDYKKIKEHLSDPRTSHEKVTLTSCDTKISQAAAVTKCERAEEWVRTETQTNYGGDAMMASPAQRPPPTTQDLKHQEKKSGTVWIKLQKNGDNWQIASVSDKPM
jgi:hypothetical protein